MPGLGPGIHDVAQCRVKEVVDARAKREHDVKESM
jgi:hypothetical protein